MEEVEEEEVGVGGRQPSSGGATRMGLSFLAPGSHTNRPMRFNAQLSG